MPKKIPIGIDNFRELAAPASDFLFVDKSLFIQEFIDKGTKVSLIIRPRRWGKTLNMTMLRYFFAPEVNGCSTQGIFDHLKIARVDNGAYLKFQGKHPVIFISFKNLKQESWDLFLNKIVELVASVYREHENAVLNSKIVSETQKILYRIILEGKCNQAQLENSLKTLSECLSAHYGQRVLILIDEYDTPLNAAYKTKHFDQIVNFFKEMFGAALKGNDSLEKGVMTGILRLSRNKMLSDINNLTLYSLMEKQYSAHFGFSEEEVKVLLQESHLPIDIKEIQRWYNGYRAGNMESVYNPWSILNCIQNDGDLKPYWIKTGDEELLKQVLLRSDKPVKEKLNALLLGESIESVIDEYLSFDEIKQGSDEILWSLLWALGYLKTTGMPKPFGSRYKYQLMIPNHEVDCSYRDVFQTFVQSLPNADKYDTFLKDLIVGNVEAFVKDLQDFLLLTTSYYDMTHESNYHIFVLALISSLKETHEIRSNKEAGLGRPDVVLIPRDLENDLGIILELKRAEVEKEVDEYKKLALAGFAQINSKKYDAELKDRRHIKRILKLCIVFYGKEAVCEYSVERVYSC